MGNKYQEWDYNKIDMPMMPQTMKWFLCLSKVEWRKLIQILCLKYIIHDSAGLYLTHQGAFY